MNPNFAFENQFDCITYPEFGSAFENGLVFAALRAEKLKRNAVVRLSHRKVNAISRAKKPIINPLETGENRPSVALRGFAACAYTFAVRAVQSCLFWPIAKSG